MGAREFDPLIGRFISADTIVPRPGDPQSFNRYMYARANPLSRVDPSGHGDCNVHQEDCLPDDGAVGGLSDRAVVNHYTRQAARHGGRYYIQKYHVKNVMNAAGIAPTGHDSLTDGAIGPERSYYSSYDESQARRFMRSEIAKQQRRNSEVPVINAKLRIDYLVVNVSVGNVSASLTTLKDGTKIISAGGGRGIAPVSAAYNLGSIQGKASPRSFTEGFSWNVSYGWFASGGYTSIIDTSPSGSSLMADTAGEGGLGTPQLGFSVNLAILRINPDNSFDWLPGIVTW